MRLRQNVMTHTLIVHKNAHNTCTLHNRTHVLQQFPFLGVVAMICNTRSPYT